MNLTPITKVKKLKGKHVLLRLDLNVPIKNGEVGSNFRIKKSLQTIRFLKKAGAKVIIISHIGRNKSDTLKPIAQYMNKYTRVGFVPDVVDDIAKSAVENIKNGSAIMLENLRKHDEELNNDRGFAKQLAEFADIYVNDAFAVSHRKNASITQLPKLLPSFIGILFEYEIKNLSFALKPPKQFLLILGGAKMETKLPLLNKYVDIAQHIYVGGALANTLLKEKGLEIGKSIADSSGIKGIKKLSVHERIILPVDVVVKNGGKVLVRKIDDISASEAIVDIGTESITQLKKLISKAKLIAVNGPLGNYEKGFDKSTIAALKSMSKSGARTIVGGGDTALFVSKLKLDKKLDFVSTGGGAMLEFLTKGTLVGIEAIQTSNKKI
ncbi:phosphoglycerate kinase [Patescibacteria group bacterium]